MKLIIILALTILVLFLYSACVISSRCSRIEEQMDFKEENFLKENIEKIKDKYPSGTRIKLVSMDDTYSVPSGTCGTVDFVDDIGTIHMKWDDGRTIGIIEGVDSFEIIDIEKNIRI